jgi:sulfonate transport system substrate-binding protein
MSAIKLESRARTRLRRIGATLFSAAMGVAITASALAADTVTLRVGDQKGGNRSLLEISGYAKDLPTRSNGRNFLLRRSSKR